MVWEHAASVERYGMLLPDLLPRAARRQSSEGLR